MKSIEFRSKKKSKEEQEREFLALSKSERLNRFIRLWKLMNSIYGKAEDIDNDNFVLIHPNYDQT